MGLEILDWRGECGDEGRRRLQEEYVEWRTVRDDDGVVQRVEVTTELPDYWTVLAGFAPQALLETVAAFARAGRVDPGAVFGDCDAVSDETTPDTRMRGFRATMLLGRSPYNTGAKAICCLVQPTNTLDALARLMGAGLRTCTLAAVESGGAREGLSADDLLPHMREQAVAARSSDPLLVERLARLAWDGRLVALDDPVGVYITGAEHTRLRTPQGEPVPPEWFRFSRGSGPEASEDGRARFQRLTLEVPSGEGYAAGDLIDNATEARIDFGGQIAELLEITVYLRVSDAGAAPPEGILVSTAGLPPADDPCDEVRNQSRAYAA